MAPDEFTVGFYHCLSTGMFPHGLMDSIVDSSIPIVRHIELEVESVDMLITGMQDEDQALHDWHVANEQANTTGSLGQSHKGVAEENQMAVIGKEDEELPSTPSPPSLRYSHLEGSPQTGRRVFHCLMS